MTLLNAQGKPVDLSLYYSNMLSHWLSFYSIAKYVEKARRMPGRQDLKLLSKKQLSKEKAAYHIGRILGDKRCKLEIAKVLYSQYSQESLTKYEDWLDKLKLEVQDMARMARAGLVTP